MTQPAERQVQLQEIVNESTKQMAQYLNAATGLPPAAIIVIVHFPEDILFGHTMAPAQPQAQMNAIDAMIKHCRTIGERLKVAINTARHGGPADPEKRH
jgi:hypothetical protein